MARRDNRRKALSSGNGKKVYGGTPVSFSAAAHALKERYMGDFPDLTLFSHFNAFGKNIVFQKIQTFPLKEIRFSQKTKSIFFKAQWTSGGALSYILPKVNFDIDCKKSDSDVEWEEISSPLRTNKYGDCFVRAGELCEIEDINTLDAALDMRVDSIRSINMYNWGFELIGDIISLAAINKRVDFNKAPKTIQLNIPTLSFNFTKLTGKEEMPVRWIDEDFFFGGRDDFDEILFSDKKEEVPVRDLGQRCMKNLILED